MCIYCDNPNSKSSECSCGCSYIAKDTILLEIEKDYRRGFIDETEVKKQAGELISGDNYEKFIQELEIEL